MILIDSLFCSYYASILLFAFLLGEMHSIVGKPGAMIDAMYTLTTDDLIISII